MIESIQPIGQLRQALMNATTPREAHAVESVSSAAKAYYHEQGMYEESMSYWKLYYQARRKTTELIQAGNMDVTEVGWTKMQWSRRVRELKVSQEKLEEYFDELIANAWHPSINGLLRHANGGEIDKRARYVTDVKRGAKGLRDEFPDTIPNEFYEWFGRLLEELE